MSAVDVIKHDVTEREQVMTKEQIRYVIYLWVLLVAAILSKIIGGEL